MNLSCFTRAASVLFALLLMLVTMQGPAEAAIDCFSCHERSAFQKRVKHEPSASGDCFSCHNPHVARFSGLLQKQTRDLCISCHDDFAGMLDQGIVHRPVIKGECTSCHDPHSSDQAALLIDRPAATCFTCHTELPRQFKNTHAPYAKGQCSSCHVPHQSRHANLLVKEADTLCLDCHSRGSCAAKACRFPGARLTIAAPATTRMAATAVRWCETFCMHRLLMVARIAMPARVYRSQSIPASSVIRMSRNRCPRRITIWCDTRKMAVWPVIRPMPEMMKGCSRAKSGTSAGLVTKPLSNVMRRQNTVM